MALSMPVIGRFGCSAAPEPPSMWSTIAIAVSSGQASTPLPASGSRVKVATK